MLPRRRPDWDWLRAWPMLGGSVTSLAFGSWLLAGSASPHNRDLAAFVMIVLGSVLLGAWIALHAINHPLTREDDDDQVSGRG